MDRREAIEKLRTYTDAVRGMGATSLYLFGSTAHARARADSDIDLFLEYDPSGHFSALDLVGIKLFLEEELGAEVDLTTRNSLHPLLRADIERSAVRIF